MPHEPNFPTAPKICVAGPGAVGTTLAVLLAKSGMNVTVVARGESFAKIGKSGLRLLDRNGDHHAKVGVSTGHDLLEQDVVFLCSKAQDLPDLVKALNNSIGGSTLVVPVVNGIPWWYFHGQEGRHAGRTVNSVDPGGSLKYLIPSKNIIGCVTMFTADRLETGYARALNPIKIVVGEIDHSSTLRCVKLANVLNNAEIETRVSERIRDPLWTKVIANLMSNPLSVVAQAPLSEVCGNAQLSQITRKLLEEALLTAAAFGARAEFEPETLLAFGAGMGDTKTSMLQDFESGRPLELGAICGSVVELAELQGIAMPLTRHIAMLANYVSERMNRDEMAA